MIPLSLAEIADAVGGRVDGDPSVLVSAEAFLDSRAPVAGGLFVALEGERLDGHEFANAAVAGGAAAVLGSRSTGLPMVLVDDPAMALGRLAGHVLAMLPGVRVLALTGSQGKTGTKDYLAQILQADGPTVATLGNLNNELGVPLTVLRATPETTYLLLEMGARGIGHIEYLCRIAPPTVAAVLNVGTAHLGEFGSRSAIAAAKGEIVESLPAHGVAVLNSDDEQSAAMASRTSARVLTFGAAGDVSWRGLSLDDLGRPAFELGHAGHWAPVRLSQVGSHQAANAAAAAAMALAVGLALPVIVAALNDSVSGSRWRMEMTGRADGVLVLNDAYNANPDSMRAALESLSAIGKGSRRRTLAVLGEMRELGEDTDAAHREVGVAVATLGVDVLVTVGAQASVIAAGAGSVSDWQGVAVGTAGRDEALAWVRNNVTAGDVVLVKASRGAALEFIAAGLLADRSEQGRPDEGDHQQ